MEPGLDPSFPALAFSSLDTEWSCLAWAHTYPLADVDCI